MLRSAPEQRRHRPWIPKAISFYTPRQQAWEVERYHDDEHYARLDEVRACGLRCHIAFSPPDADFLAVFLFCARDEHFSFPHLLRPKKLARYARLGWFYHVSVTRRSNVSTRDKKRWADLSQRWSPYRIHHLFFSEVRANGVADLEPWRLLQDPVIEQLHPKGPFCNRRWHVSL